MISFILQRCCESGTAQGTNKNALLHLQKEHGDSSVRRVLTFSEVKQNVRAKRLCSQPPSSCRGAPSPQKSHSISNCFRSSQRFTVNCCNSKTHERLSKFRVLTSRLQSVQQLLLRWRWQYSTKPRPSLLHPGTASMQTCWAVLEVLEHSNL